VAVTKFRDFLRTRERRGRDFIRASNELGQFEYGCTAQWFGAIRAVVLGGLGTLVVTGLWAWYFPELRRPGKRSKPAG
jgi:hypothetical protein